MNKAKKQKIEISVPVRADLAGGTSDIAFYLEKYGIEHGSVVNISLPVKIKIKVEVDYSSDKVKVSMPDLGEIIEGDISSLQKQEKNNACQIINHFLRFFALDYKGLKVEISSSGKIPPASGLGTSSAIGVGLITALSDIYGVYGINAPEFNYLVETSMGILGGKQDYYAAWLEGLNYLIFNGPHKCLVGVRDSFPINHKLYKWVLERIVVYYSGSSRSSGKMNEQFQEKISKDPSIFARIAFAADKAYQAIKASQEEKLAEAINEDRRLHLELSSLNYTKEMEELGGIGEQLGYAHRACGAGGGGCILFFGNPENHSLLIKKLKKLNGFQVC